MNATIKHFPKALQNTWLCNPQLVRVIMDPHCGNRAIINDGVFIEKVEGRDIDIVHDGKFYSIKFSVDHSIRSWYLTGVRLSENKNIPYTICHQDKVIVGQNGSTFPYEVIGEHDHATVYCFVEDKRYYTCTYSEIKKHVFVKEIITEQSVNIAARFFNNESTPEKEQAVKKYLKDKTLYNGKVPGSTEVEITTKDGKFYILCDELKEDNRSSAEVIKEQLIADLKAKLPTDTPEWGKHLLTIIEAYQQK